MNKRQFFSAIACLGGALAFGSSASAVVVGFDFEADLRNNSPFHSLTFNGSISADGNTTEQAIALPGVVTDFFAANPTVSGSFSYDTDAAPTFDGASFNNYPGVHFTVSLNDPDTGAFQVQQAPTFVTVSQFPTRHTVNVNTSFQPLTGGALTLDNAGPATFTVDLMQDSSLASELTLPAISELWVRLTLPTTLPFEFMNLSLGDPTATANADQSLPATINLADFGDSLFSLQLISNMSVAVDESDYASTDDFNTASAWVASNITSVSYRIGSNFTPTLLTGGADPGTTPNVPFLPGGTSGDSFVFTETVTGGDVWWFDPVVAIGYEYELLSGPLMTSATAMAIGTQTEFFISAPGFFTNELLTAGVAFDFTAYDPNGLSFFTITGIDPSWMLDPTDPLAFITGLTFIDDGEVQLTMTPITQEVDGGTDGPVDGSDDTDGGDDATDGTPPPSNGAVPEPATVGLIALALAAITRRRSA